MTLTLNRFSIERPRYQVPQGRILDWLATAHAEAEAALHGLGPDERDAFRERLQRVIARVACGPDRIATRGLSISDLREPRWDDDSIYDVRRRPHGAGTAERTRLYGELVDAYFERAYAADDTPPRDLVHVTCTGYLSPSGAQRLVARRGWGARTRVTHAYQMGCYAALPAVRIAAGLCDVPGDEAAAPRVDLVHTELCSLHLDPTDHAIDQLVVQSLFADGMIRYSLAREYDDGVPGLRLIAAHEQIMADSADAMTWTVSDHGMRMTLARDIPDRIAGAVGGFVKELLRRAGRDVSDARRALFAVHPGGPKIIDRVRATLELHELQVAASRAVLLDHGNMSSATLPHIWMRMLDDPRVVPGTAIVSLAFGPGLTLCGALFEKR